LSLFKRPPREAWYYEFTINKTTYRKSTGTSNKREALQIEAKAHAAALEDQREQRDGVKRMTLYEVSKKWLEVSEMTHRDHQSNLSRARKLFGAECQRRGAEWVLVEGARFGLPKTLMVHDITQSMLHDLKAARVAEGNTTATINRELGLIHTLMGYAKSLDIVMPSKEIVWSDRRNRAASLVGAERKGKLRWLTVEEETRLIAALAERIVEGDKAAQDNHDLVVMLLDTGARYSEIAELPWRQVDLENGTLHLFRSKTQNESVFRLTRRVQEILRRRKETTWPKSYVFPAQIAISLGKTASSEGGRPRYPLTDYAEGDRPRGHSTDSIQGVIDKLGLNDDPTLDRVTPHTFRDTYASRLVQAGVSLLKVQKLLGHSTPMMTQKYAHLSPDATGQEAADVLDRMRE
jgi:integrase